MISDIRFHMVTEVNGLIGFISFLYNSELKFSEVPVHLVNFGKEKVKFRVVYPETRQKNQHYWHPISKAVHEEINREVNAYLLAQHKYILEAR